MTIPEYLKKIETLYKTGNAREHAYRGDLQTLLMSILPDVLVTNEPARVECGAPDYVLTRKDIPVGYIEAKDIGVDLNSKTLKEQFDRYKSGLSNLILTDYLTFQFFKDKALTISITIAKVEHGRIIPLSENFDQFTTLIVNFANTITQTIKSPTKLAEMMAGKARLMADVIEKSLDNDDQQELRSNLKSQMLSFKQMLIHDIDNKAFADIYAQTIAYGMFAARYHDSTLATFSRMEAAQLIPRSNPFLRNLFQEIAGFDLDDRLVWIVDELVSIFLASDVAEIMKNFGKSTKQEDPVVHFYETFLAEYNPALRKARGVWYTPQPVVNFIVRAVDDVLKSEFKLPNGIADTSKVKIKRTHVTKATSDKRSKMKEVELEHAVHKVQILDPATGTGTFLAEVVRQIYKKFEHQQGAWSNYVTNDLIPRLNGFELLMASYAMAHLKMDMLLTETGYKPNVEQRFRIYLTNSLEEADRDTRTLFSAWLSDEAEQANSIKHETPVMVVMGNPPYSGVSSNNGEWISNLIEDYKYIDGVHFKERKHWLNDDYVKFIRYGQYYIEKNGSGVLAFINPHGYLDNPTFRGMRWNLLRAFDKIYTIDLHGNSKKKETAPDGSADINVFDIQQGVSINIFIKTGKKKQDESGKVFHHEVFGTRELKYDFLHQNSLDSISFQELNPETPFVFFMPKNNVGIEQYENGFKVNEIFPLNNVGVVTANDALNISISQTEHKEKINDLLTMEENSWRIKYNRPKDAQSWKYRWAKDDAFKNQNKNLSKISYRPFDDRWTLYTGKSGGLYARPIFNVMQHFQNGQNTGLVVGRQSTDKNWCNVQVTKNMIDNRYHFSYKGIPSEFPLYIYHDSKGQQTIIQRNDRTPNLNEDIVSQISNTLSLTFTNEKQSTENTFAPIDILDYIYAVLHNPIYRKKYNEFLKIDFPRVPYPIDVNSFWQLVKHGGELRMLHLLESPTLDNLITKYPVDGSNKIENIRYTPNGAVYINDVQYFEGVPTSVWEFYIGGYQPAQKWLKDRKGRELSYDDIIHYQKIIVALNETMKVMKDIEGFTA